MKSVEDVNVRTADAGVLGLRASPAPAFGLDTLPNPILSGAVFTALIILLFPQLDFHRFGEIAEIKIIGPCAGRRHPNHTMEILNVNKFYNNIF